MVEVATGRWRITVAVIVVLIAALIPPVLSAIAQSSGARDIGDACRFAPEDGFEDTGEDGTEVETAIDCIAWYGITSGMNATEYAPHESITRAQMATMIAISMRRSAIEFAEPTAEEDAFTDDDKSPHEHNINFLAKHGVVEGIKGSDRYQPKEPVTREQMATYLVRQLRAIGAPIPEPGSDYFSDDDESFHEANINIVAELRIAVGGGDRSYDPKGEVTRGQMALFIARDLAYLVEQKYLAPPGSAITVLDSPELLMIDIEDDAVIGQSTVRFTFDEVIDTIDATAFRLYDERAEGVEALEAKRDPGDTTSVLASFNDAAVDKAVVGAVAAGAVLAADDETANPEGALPAPITGNRRAQTSGPDLVQVLREEYEGTLPGLQAGYQVTFTFDEAVTLSSEHEFAVYTQDGERTVLEGGLDPSSGCSEGERDTDIVCIVNSNDQGAAADAVENARLGGVAAASVTDADGLTNPEGAAVVREPPQASPSPSPSESASPQ